MKRLHLYASRLCQWAGLLGLGLLLPAGLAHGLGLTNGSFETGDTTGWVGWPNPEMISVVSDAAAHEGTKIAKMDFVDANKLIQDIANPAAVIIPGQPYTLTAWYKYSTDKTQDAPALIWHYMDASGALVGSYNVYTAGGGNKDSWVKMEYDMVGQNDPTLRIILMGGAGMGATGTAWFDDVRLDAPAAGFTDPLKNGSFETGDIAGWIGWPSPAKISVVSDAAAPDGAKVAKVDFTAGTSGLNKLVQDISSPAAKLIPGKAYTVSAWFHFTSDKPDDNASLNWHYYDATGALVGDYKSAASNNGNTDTWTKLSGDITTLDAPTFRVILQAGAGDPVNGTGTAWFDNVAITEAAVTLTNALTNPSFETGDFTGWVVWPAAAKASVISDATAPDGAKAAKVDFSDANQLIQDVASPAAKVVPGQAYSLSAWYRFTSDKATDGPSMNWLYFDSGGAATGWHPLAGDTGNSSAWKMISTTMTGENQPQLRVILNAGASVGGNGTAWFDDVRLGTPADISGPAAVDFGTQDTAAGPTAAKPVDIQNPGPGELEIGQIGLATGTEFSITAKPTLPAIVPAGGKVTVSVVFDPNPPDGSATDTLSVISNAPSKSTFNIPLSGLKVPVELATFSAE